MANPKLATTDYVDDELAKKQDYFADVKITNAEVQLLVDNVRDISILRKDSKVPAEILIGDPTIDGAAATKRYVDDETKRAIDTCSPAIVAASDTGKAFTVNDSSESVIKGLTAYGESTQDGTPTPDSPVEIVNIENPVISVYGKNLFDKDTMIISGAYVSGTGQYQTSASTEKTAIIPVPKNSTVTFSKIVTSILRVGLCTVYPTSGTQLVSFQDVSNKMSFTAATGNNSYLVAFFYNNEGETVNYEEVINSIQLEIGSTVTNYEPYTAQTVTVPYTFRGLKNSSGDWVARDELKVGDAKVEIVRNCYSFLVDETGANLFALNNTANVMGYVVTTETKSEISAMKSQSRACGMCSRFEPITNNRWAGQIEGQGIVFGGNNQAIYLLNLIQELPTKDDFIQYCTANPFEIIYWRDTPEIEDITATEAGQALLALKTNYPSTSVISDIDLNLTYRADTKNYIDNKIAERLSAIETAILNNI